jgi:hypothetical protein
MIAEVESSTQWKPKSNRWLIAATVALAAFMEVLDTSIANVALPHIAGDLGASTSQGTQSQRSGPTVPGERFGSSLPQDEGRAYTALRVRFISSCDQSALKNLRRQEHFDKELRKAPLWTLQRSE